MMRASKTRTIYRLLPVASGGSYLDVVKQKLTTMNSVTAFFLKSYIVKDAALTLSTLKIEPALYAASKALFTIVGVLAVLPIIVVGALGMSIATLVLAAAGAIAGFLLPELYVAERMWRRGMRLRAQFPNFLDLLKLYTASPGYGGFGQALVSIAEAMQGELGEELRHVSAQARFVGHERTLRELAARFPYPAARDLVATLRLEHVFGGGIAPKIALLADEAQKDRLAHARAAGQRSSVGLLVPLLFFHFPVALILFILPFAYSIMQALGTN